MKSLCVCPGGVYMVGMRDLEDREVGFYPVFVFNVKGDQIGFASNKAQYISIWNADEDNQAVGVLSGFKGPFNFIINLKPGEWIDHVIGDNDGVGPGVFVPQFQVQFY